MSGLNALWNNLVKSFKICSIFGIPKKLASQGILSITKLLLLMSDSFPELSSETTSYADIAFSKILVGAWNNIL